MTTKTKTKTKEPDFLRRYMYVQGRSEIPLVYHRFSCISLIAACLSDRVSLVKHAGSPMHANLYTILVGDSASGKGKAIDEAEKLARAVLGDDCYRGKLTGAHLADIFAARQKALDEDWDEESDRPRPIPSMYLMFPEMGMSVGEGPVAVDLVKRLTELFTGGKYTWREGTRTHGSIEFECPTLNFIGGSIPTWLYQSVPRSAVEGGFFARALVVAGKRDFSIRIANPETPPDRDRMYEWLVRRCAWMAQLKGEFHFSNAAKLAHKDWYDHRPPPNDDTMAPAWLRADDLVRKLSIVAAVSGGTKDFTIRRHHFLRALRWVNEVHKGLPKLISGAAKTYAFEQIDAIAKYIEDAGILAHQALVKKASHRGMVADVVKQHVRDLHARGRIEIKTDQRHGGVFYEWIAPPALEDDEEELERKMPPVLRKKRKRKEPH